jgi:hypothetical protein
LLTPILISKLVLTIGNNLLYTYSKDVPEEAKGEASFTFVTDGIESAIRQAKAVAVTKIFG